MPPPLFRPDPHAPMLPPPAACWIACPQIHSPKRISLAQDAEIVRKIRCPCGSSKPAGDTRWSRCPDDGVDALLKKEELKNWTCDEVIEYASSIIAAEVLSVDALKAAKLNGAGLLELRQNQSLVDAMISDGMDSTVVYKLAGAVRKLVPPVQGVF